MRKVPAQNPNLLRTLLGLSFTLIFILGYAVYGATVSPSYYLYDSDTQYNSDEVTLKIGYTPETNKTTWTWQTTLDTSNLTWVNFTLEAVDSPIVTISTGGLFYHEDLETLMLMTFLVQCARIKLFMKLNLFQETNSNTH